MKDQPYSEIHPIKLAIASGKGGTGKTTVAVSLAQSFKSGQHILIDCDVEAPNAHLSLNPLLTDHSVVNKAIPVIDRNKCTYCGQCAQACKFNAISINSKASMALTFPNLCHACGVCSHICPENAISEKEYRTGSLAWGQVSSILDFANGHLEIGAAIATPIIRELKKWALLNRIYDFIILDSPPGTSCAVVETIRDADFVLLVTEPTPFGLHDLEMTLKLAQSLKKPCVIIINRDGIGDVNLESVSQIYKAPILGRIPLRRDIAEALSTGFSLIEAFPEYQPVFNDILLSIQQIVGRREK